MAISVTFENSGAEKSAAARSSKDVGKLTFLENFIEGFMDMDNTNVGGYFEDAVKALSKATSGAEPITSISPRRARIISAFPGCGKTTLFNQQQEISKRHGYEFIIIDSDSSEFSCAVDRFGNSEFPDNYIQRIQAHLDKADLILVSTHEEVTKALQAKGLMFEIVYPPRAAKEEYLLRYKLRGNNAAFIQFMDDNWESFISGIRENHYPMHHELPTGRNLADFVFGDYLLRENFAVSPFETRGFSY